MFGAQYAGGAREGGPPLGSPRTLPRPLNLRFRPFRSTLYIYCKKLSLLNFLNLGLQFLHTFYMYLEELLYIDISKKIYSQMFS
jgi:hypothetical protein